MFTSILTCSKVFNFSDIELECQATFRELMSSITKDVNDTKKTSDIMHFHSSYIYNLSEDEIKSLNRLGFLNDKSARGKIECTSIKGGTKRNIRYKIYEEVTYSGVRVLFVITDGDFRLVAVLDFNSAKFLVCMDFLDFANRTNKEENIKKYG